MAPTCAHTDCKGPIPRAGGRYCEQHGIELALVLATLDDMRHVPDEAPE